MTVRKNSWQCKVGGGGSGRERQGTTNANSDTTEKVNIYETEEILRHPAFRHYTAGGVSVVVHPESGVHDGTWKPADTDSASVDFLTARAVCVCAWLVGGDFSLLLYLSLVTLGPLSFLVSYLI